MDGIAMAFEKNIQIIFLSLILMGCGGASNSVKDVEQHNQNEAEKLITTNRGKILRRC